jgi:signal transduction histidine kinase/HAMP domain-containing protein
MTDLGISNRRKITLDHDEILRALRAFQGGDFSVRMPTGLAGVDGELAAAFNDVVRMNEAMAAEFARVRDQVGTQGRTNDRARVPTADGAWRDCVDSVNALIGDLVQPTSEMARVMDAVAKGDLSKKITVNAKGEILALKSTINTMVDQLNAFASEVSRVAREVGTEGKLGGQAQVPGVTGTWKDLTDNVNRMAANLTGQVRNIATVTTAVAKGDLSKKITVDARGEILELKNTINTMVDQLNALASEVSRVAREVGTEGKLGGQAQVPGVAGTWKGLTDNVNLMAANLTSQVRGIANIVTAVANGDLDHKVVFVAKGEIASLADTINGMIDTLATFAEQVTNVAREVGVEGKLGGQAKVPGAAGLWRGLTDNVNQLAAHLTTQVRAIAEVATAVAKGDLTRSITVDARGEVAALKDNVNEMIRNLAGTTRKNTEQDWLKTNLANFGNMLQGQRDLVAVSNLILAELAPLVNAQQGVIYSRRFEAGKPRLDALATCFLRQDGDRRSTPRFHEDLVEQCAAERKRILLNDVPLVPSRGAFGPGAFAPPIVVIMPVLFEGQVKAVIELAARDQFSRAHLSFLEQLTESIGIVFNTIESTMRTEHLLAQSQSLAAELQSRQEDSQRANQRLEENARQLSEQMTQVEYKNREVEQAKAALEEKAEQLALSSRYKSEFLANMSHELRTPLNSLLILAQMLAESPATNLTTKQIEYAQTIYAAGNDLLALINDVLDLAKVESGTVSLDFAAERFDELQDFLDRSFRQVGRDKDLLFTISMQQDVPAAIWTDAKRLRQILKNLLSNAFKFTGKGSVSLEIALATSGWTPGQRGLDEAQKVVAFSVIDTGIGIAPDVQEIIFEAFQQADGTTSRHFGGTGLGLSISSRLSRLLGGDIRVQSSPGKGSTFTLFLPLVEQTPEDNADTLYPQPSRRRAPPQPVDSKLFLQDAIMDGAPGAGKLVPGLAGRKLLLVDDDIRNIFALTSVLEGQGMIVLNAENGLDGIEMLKSNSGIDIILMDMMMPELDGYDTMRVIRSNERFRGVPIIGVSAKAMKGDREKCIEAGASDYITKPVNIDDLLSLVQAWLVN